MRKTSLIIAVIMAILISVLLSGCIPKDLSFIEDYWPFLNGEKAEEKENTKNELTVSDDAEVSGNITENVKDELSEAESETASPSESENPDIEVSVPVEEEEAVTENEENEAKPLDEKSAISAMNALLVGFGYTPLKNFDAVDEEIIVSIISAKLMWGDYLFGSDPYLSEAGLEFTTGENGYIHYDLSRVKKITKDIFGIDFPVNAEYYMNHTEGSEFLVMPAIGESSSLSIQKVKKDGDVIYAYGTSISNYNSYSEFNGYFQAQFKENSSSIYGYTLISFDLISGNQNFKELKASASSVLKEEGEDYGAYALIDGNPDTTWVEAAEGVGAGEWVKIETVDGSKLNISAIGFSLGFQRDERLLKNNGWPSRVLLEFESGYTQVANFYECYTPTAIMLKEPQNTSFVKITILDAVEGAAYEDSCITEITLFGLD